METKSNTAVREWRQTLDSSGWWHSFELPDGSVIHGANSVDGQKRRLSQFPIPDDLRGARVLDIGAWDGWFTFELERRGADVVAIDCWDNPKFRQMHSTLRSRADYRVMDVYDLTPGNVGRFDIVIFMGVLYHLKHPLLALERVCALTTNLAAVDSFILQKELRGGEDVPVRPMLEFYEGEEFGGQTDNWCAPNLPGLMALCRTAGFARVEHLRTLEYGACVACYRTWQAPKRMSGMAPDLFAALHHTTFGLNFDSSRDEYVNAQFRCERECSFDTVFPQVGGYGVRPVHLSRMEDGAWRTNLKLPPGLTRGWHDVAIRVGDGPLSNARPVAVDLPAPGPVEIAGAQDGATWKPGELDLARGRVISLWVPNLPDNADGANLRVELGGERLKVEWIEPYPGGATRQINVSVPDDTPEGVMDLRINGGTAVTFRLSRAT